MNILPTSTVLWISCGMIFLVFTISLDGLSLLDMAAGLFFFIAAWVDWRVTKKQKTKPDSNR